MTKKERNRPTRSKNVGIFDSILRVVLGSLILILGVVMESLWGLVGLVLIATGAISWCPVYKLFGIKTCRPDLEVEV